MKGTDGTQEVVVDDNDDDSMALPGVGRTSETLREQLGNEMGVDLRNGTDLDSINLRVIKPRSSREPFPLKQRIIGVTIVSIITLIALWGIRSSYEYIVLAAITLIVIGYVMSQHHQRPSFEGMVYILIILMIILTGLGSQSASGLEIYAAGVVVLLLVLFARMTRNYLLAVPMVLYAIWAIIAYMKTVNK